MAGQDTQILDGKPGRSSLARALEIDFVLWTIEREKREVSNRNDAQKVRAGASRLPNDVRSAGRDLPDMREETEE